MRIWVLPPYILQADPIIPNIFSSELVWRISKSYVIAYSKGASNDTSTFFFYYYFLFILSN